MYYCRILLLFLFKLTFVLFELTTHTFGLHSLGSISWSRDKFNRQGSIVSNDNLLSCQMALIQKSITNVPVIALMSLMSCIVISTSTTTGFGSGRAFLQCVIVIFALSQFNHFIPSLFFFRWFHFPLLSTSFHLLSFSMFLDWRFLLFVQIRT